MTCDWPVALRPFGSPAGLDTAIVRCVKSTCELPPPGAADDPAGGGREPLIGVGSWLGAVSSYLLSGDEKQRTLAVTVTPQCGYGLPGQLDRPADTAARAAEQAAQYRLIRSQLDDPGLAVSLLSTLHPGLVLPVAEGAPSLRRHVAAAELLALAGAAATPPCLTGIATLGELMDRYGLIASRLGAANADQPLNGLLAAGQPLAMRTGQIEPDTVPADPSTLAQVAARLGITAERLLEDNRGLRLAADPSFVLPGIVALAGDARTPCLLRAGDTLAALARRFGTTARDLVADNAEVTGALLAGVHVEVSVETLDEIDETLAEASDESGDEGDDEAGDETRPETGGEMTTASTETVAGDSFGSVRDRLAEQHPGVTLDAVADALDRLGAVLATDVVLTCPLAVLGSDRDGDAAPLTADELEAEHGCSPAAFAAANAAVLGVLQPAVRLSVGAATTTTTECDTVNAVLGRLAPHAGTASIAQLLADNAATPMFRPGGRAVLPPPPAILTASSKEAVELAAPAVRLVVTLRLERPGAAASPAGNGMTDVEPPAEHADSVVPPASHDQDVFVDACLAALPDIRLATDARGELWAVSFGADGIASVRVEPSAGGALGPKMSALRLPYQGLLDFSARVRPVTELGSLGTPVLQHFQGLDVELLARSFLTDLDRYLGEPLSGQLSSAVCERLSDVRRRLAGAIPGALAPLLDEPDHPAAAAGLLSARAALAGIARDSLTSAYGSALAQHRAVAVSPYGRDGLPAAWLHGTVTASGRPDLDLSESRTELREPEGWCAFALTSKDPTGAATVSLHADQVFHALELGSPDLDPSSAEPVLLRFVRPLAGSYRPETVAAEVPPADLPLPIRELPHPVSAQAMTAEPTFTGPGLPTLAEAAQWTAGLIYTHQHAAQDVVRIWMPLLLMTSSPGDGPAVRGAAVDGLAPSSMALAEALAGYAAAGPELARLIGSDVHTPDGVDVQTPDALRGNAGAALAELATAVVTAWGQHWADPHLADPGPGDTGPTDPDPTDPDPTDPHLTSAATASAGPANAQLTDYRLRAVYTTDTATGSTGEPGEPGGDRLLDRLVVSRDRDEDGWPVITLVKRTEQVPLTPGPVTDKTREYTAAERPAAPGPVTLRLDWPGLRGKPHPDAQIALWVERNRTLPAGAPTSPAFVLTARPTRLDPVNPAVRWSERLPLTGANLADALQNGFDDLFGTRPAGCRLRVEVSYAAPVSPPPLPDVTPINASPAAGSVSDQWMVLPALLSPELLLAPDTAAILAAELEAWRQAYQPTTDGAEWRLRLALLSTSGEPPLLAMDQLVFPASSSSRQR